MMSISSLTEPCSRGAGITHPTGRDRRSRGGLVGLAALLAASLAYSTGAGAQSVPAAATPRPMPVAATSRLPTIPAGHRHARSLLEHALRYVAPGSQMIDPSSGYPVEGWNHDPKKGLFLRSFTQLTAIGLYMELLGSIIAGEIEAPDLSHKLALSHLARLVKSLRQDQRAPYLGAKGLLGNFLDLATGERLGPLASDVEKSQLVEFFGPEKGEAIWKALEAKKWIVPRNEDREAGIERGPDFGSEHFDGPLAPYNDPDTKRKVMEILDRRVVMIVFGDNSNLSSSVAKTIGALLVPAVADRPEVAELRRELGRFLDDQRPGYTHLYDTRAGLFNFGWDASRDRLFGWEDLQGIWKTGHMDYLVNEFRAPVSFIAVRYGFPDDPIANMGLKIKPYRMPDGRDVYVLAPWEGSAFQALGLTLFLGEHDRPSWRTLLKNVVEVEVDFSTRHKLPGFLSESYTGHGTEYSGRVGIPEITVSPKPRITDAASLYTLGIAYSIAPDRVERFLAANWAVIATLLTDHGPWEGYNVTRHEPIRFQTSAHTLSLILGFLGTGSEHMNRYLVSLGLDGRLAALAAPGERVDLSSAETRVFAWADKESTLQSTREGSGFHVKGDRVQRVGIAFVPARSGGVSLSGGRLSLRYRSARPIDPASIELKPVGDAPADIALISKEITTRFDATGEGDREIEVHLPATPGLAHIKEIVIVHESATGRRPIDLTITHLGFTPDDSPRE